LKGVRADIETVLEECGIEPTRRAETLSLEEFCKLARAVG